MREESRLWFERAKEDIKNAELNLDFLTTRYPDAANALPSEIFDRTISSDHLNKAKEVMRWVTERMK